MDKATRPIKVRNFKRTPAPTRLLIMVVLALSIVLVVSTFLPQTDNQAADSPVQGNTFANLGNRGLSASADGALYYSDVGADSQVMKLSPDTGAVQPLDGVQGIYLNALGQDLYYIAQKDGSVHRYLGATRMDNLLLPGPCTQLCLYEDALYFVDIRDGESLYAMALDGTDIRKLSAARIESFIIVNQKIYYSDLNESGKSYRMNLDGTNPSDTPVPLGSHLFVNGGSIYFTQPGDARLRRVNMSSSETTSFDQVTSLSVNAEEPYLFFADTASGNRLCRAPIAGGEKEYLTHGPVYGVQVVGDYVGYISADSATMEWILKDKAPLTAAAEQSA